MESIFALVGDFLAFLFVDMDGAGVVYTNGAIPFIIDAILAVPLLTIGLAVSITGLAVTYLKKFRRAV